jgi:hypothetical protein
MEEAIRLKKLAEKENPFLDYLKDIRRAFGPS